MHPLPHPARLLLLLASLLLPACVSQSPPRPDHSLKVATWNIEDVRTADLLQPTPESKARLQSIAAAVDALNPQILLLNEIAFDRPAPTQRRGLAAKLLQPHGQNAQRFADQYLPHRQFTAWMPESNTGQPSGHDLDRSGQAVTELPPFDPAQPQTPAQRA